MNELRLIKSFLILILSGNLAIAQSTSFTTKLSASKVGVDDNFTVTYSTNKDGDFIAPNFKNFDVINGPSRGHSSSISVINGKMTQSVTISYSYTLSPKKVGQFNVPGAKIKIGNATYQSKPVKVTVVKESQIRKRRNLFDDFFGGRNRNNQPRTIDDKAFYAKTIVSKSQAYEGEHIIVSYKIYARGLSVQLEDYNFPTHEGFWTENIELPQTLQPEIKIINGQQYQIYTLRKEVLFPQRSGDLKIKPFDVTARLNQSFFNSGTKKKVTSNGVTIKGLPLPAGAPSNFENQVGDYSFHVEVLADTVKVDEPIDVKITVKGKGNLKQLGQLSLDFPTNFETYDPTVKDRLTVNASGVAGSKLFSYLVIPRKSGKYEFGPLSFSYFDLKTKQYKTLSSKKFNLVVLNQNGEVNDKVIHSSNKAVTVNEDINGIARETIVKEKGNYFFNSFGYYGLIVGIGGLFLAFLFVTKRWDKESADTVENRIKKARKKLEKKLAVAKSFLDQNNSSAFNSETIKALYQYINDKLQIETSQMSKQNIKEVLMNKGINDSTVNEFIVILENCEMSQYAALSHVSDREVYQKSLNIIEQIEKEFKV